MKAKLYADIVQNVVNNYGLSLDHHFVASSNDGAAIMVAYSQMIPCEKQLCYLHAFHLAVKKVLYERKTAIDVNNSPGDIEDMDYDDYENLPANMEVDEEADEDDLLGSPILASDSDDDEVESEGDESSAELEETKTEKRFRKLTLKQTFQDKIQACRNVVKHFKNSVIRTGLMNRDRNQQQIKLRLDVPTRWNSLLAMINSILESKPLIIKHLKTPDEKALLRGLDFNFLESMKQILSPIEEGMLLMSKDDSNLLSAEAALKYVFSELSSINTDVSMDLCNELEVQFKKRRNKNMVSLLKFLNTGSIDFTTEKVANGLAYSKQKDMEAFAQKLLNRLFPHEDSSDSDSSKEKEDSTASPVKKDLNYFLQQENSGIQKVKTGKIHDDFELVKRTKVLPDNLKKLYAALLTVKPSSIASESSFSNAVNFATKQRNRMEDNLLDSLLISKYFFKDVDSGLWK